LNTEEIEAINGELILYGIADTCCMDLRK